jgi:hypothetical protein
MRNNRHLSSKVRAYRSHRTKRRWGTLASQSGWPNVELRAGLIARKVWQASRLSPRKACWSAGFGMSVPFPAFLSLPEPWLICQVASVLGTVLGPSAMSNPYQTPTEETRERSARPWMILSGFLLVALIFMCIAFVTSYRRAEMARAQAQKARSQAVMSQQQAMEARKAAEAASANE